MNTFKLIIFTVAVTCSESRIINSPRQARLSLAEGSPSYYYKSLDGNPETYMFGYDVSDGNSGNSQFRTEERFPNGTVVGSYGYVDPDGRPHRYTYIADHRGYRVMRDRPIQNQYVPNNQWTQDRTTTTESSITWTRPKKQNNKYSTRNRFLEKSTNSRNSLISQNYNLPMFNKQYY